MKRLPLILALPAFAVSAFASALTPEQALERMKGNAPMRMAAKETMNLKLVHTAKTISGSPAVYIFDRPSDSGFVLLSADDVAYPVLGYVDNGAFDPTDIPTAMKWWLQEYCRQIEYATRNGAGASKAPAKADRPAIEPMVKTKWNQGKPYNNQCPRINDVRTVTGCVATAMAQIMNYHKYPEKGTGQVTIELEGSPDPFSLNLANEAFDWKNMLDDYSGDYTTEQADAVAYLMKACGYSVGMSYSTTESGAASFYVGDALINNFNYNPNISYEERVYYATSSWEQMVYDELAANRPVLYSGQSEGGGHAFVCDGYREDGYFHINWGWGGLSDGYFLLQSLNPDDLGIGGGTGGGFSFSQSIIKGVQPTSQNTSYTPNLCQTGNLYGSRMSTSRISFSCLGSNSGWWNMGYRDAVINMGVIIEPLDNPSAGKTEVIGSRNNQMLEKLSLKSLYGITSLTFIFPSKYADGKYKATVATQDASSANAPWIPVKHEGYFSNHAIITKTGSRYTIEFPAEKAIRIDASEFLSELHYGSAVKMKVQVSNPTDTELTQTVAPVLAKDGINWFVGTGIPIHLNPGETATKEIAMTFTPQDDAEKPVLPLSLTLNFVNLDSGTVFDFSSQVEMLPEEKYSISVSDMEIADTDFTVENQRRIFEVKDPSDIMLSAMVTCESGYFGFPVYALVFPNKGGYNLTSAPLSPVLTIAEGERQAVSGKITFDQAADGALYFIQLYYEKDSKLNQIDDARCLFRVNTSAVGEIYSAEEMSLSFDRATMTLTAASPAGIVAVAASDMSGKSVDLQVSPDGGSASTSLAGLQRGIYILTARDADGAVRSIKVAL